jgi:UDP-N-acetylmuramoyl-tripeptide--D-alanyl-D-alanine ligase
MNCKSVSIDTRKIELNSFFVALKGDRFDAANTFAEALGKGRLICLMMRIIILTKEQS